MSAAVFATIASFKKILLREHKITFFRIVEVALFQKLIIYFFHQV